MNSTHKACVLAVAAAFAFATGTAFAESLAVKEDAAQLKSDKAALQRQLKRLEADEARLKSDTASGRMSAESKDAYEVYKAKEAIKGEKKDIAADKAASLQKKSDKAALQRQVKRLEAAEARLKSDTMSGKMAAVSDDAERFYKDRQAIKAEEKQIAADKAKLLTDQKK
jgi:hypothetical protein